MYKSHKGVRVKWLYLLVVFSVLLAATPLHEAVIAVDEKKVAALLKQSVDINTQDNKGNTPLHYAASIGRLNIVKMLLAKNPNVYIENSYGDTPLGLAIKYNHIASINAIIALQKKQKKQVKYTQLQQYIMDSNQRLSGRIFDLGYSVESPDANGVTLLHLALNHRRYTMAKYLISRGADVCRYDNEHRDALYYVQRSRGTKMTKYIKKLRKSCE